MNIKDFMPKNYGNIITNFSSINDNKNKIGIVIPTFGRIQYVKQTLESISKSNLDNCILCIIDETNSKLGYCSPNYTEYVDIDSDGYDIRNIQGNLETLSIEANKEEKCIAYNSNGWLKYRLNDSFNYFENTNNKLYIRNDILDNNHDLKQKLEKYVFKEKEKDLELENLLVDFNIENIPIIKIFKTQHGNMYDSFRVGWDLLFNCFHCKSVMSLDSDTIVKKDWISILDELYEKIIKEHKYFIITGDNNCYTKKDYNDYYTKYHIATNSIFFSKDTYLDIIKDNLINNLWNYNINLDINKYGIIVSNKINVMECIYITPVNTLIIQTSPLRTASTLLVNILYGLFTELNDKPIIRILNTGWEKKFTNNIIGIIKMHELDIDYLISNYFKYNLYFICSERIELNLLIDEKYKKYPNLICFSFKELNKTNIYTIEDIIINIKKKLKKKLNIELDTISALKRIKLMNNKYNEIQHLPFSYIDPFFEIHGSHRNRKNNIN